MDLTEKKIGYPFYGPCLIAECDSGRSGPTVDDVNRVGEVAQSEKLLLTRTEMVDRVLLYGFAVHHVDRLFFFSSSGRRASAICSSDQEYVLTPRPWHDSHESVVT